MITWLPTPGVLQGAPHAPAQDRAPVQWTGAVTTHTYLPTKTLEDVVPIVRPRFEELVAHAASLGLSPKIRSAGRTCEEQAEQVKLGFSSADLCRSMHVLGHAVDLDLTPNTCESHTKLGSWWESRGGVWGGRWTGAKFGACGDMGHYHFGFNGAGAVPTATCPAGVTLAACQKLREEYLDRAFAAGPGVSSRSGLWAGLAIVGVGVAFVWAALSVKPGRLAGVRENPVQKPEVVRENEEVPGYRLGLVMNKAQEFGRYNWSKIRAVAKRETGENQLRTQIEIIVWGLDGKQHPEFAQEFTDDGLSDAIAYAKQLVRDELAMSVRIRGLAWRPYAQRGFGDRTFLNLAEVRVPS